MTPPRPVDVPKARELLDAIKLINARTDGNFLVDKAVLNWEEALDEIEYLRMLVASNGGGT